MLKHQAEINEEGYQIYSMALKNFELVKERCTNSIDKLLDTAYYYSLPADNNTPNLPQNFIVECFICKNDTNFLGFDYKHTFCKKCATSIIEKVLLEKNEIQQKINSKDENVLEESEEIQSAQSDDEEYASYDDSENERDIRSHYAILVPCEKCGNETKRSKLLCKKCGRPRLKEQFDKYQQELIDLSKNNSLYGVW